MVIRIAERIYQGAGWIIAIGMIAVIVACSGTEVGNPDTGDPILPSDSNLERLSGDQELETYLKEQYAKSVNVHVVSPSPVPGTDGGAPSEPSEDASTPTSGDYSETNLQEAGVDESDMVKTDGAFFYIASQRAFNVVDISGNMEVVATRTVDGYIDALYLYDNKLVVLYQSSEYDIEPWEDIAVPMGPQLFGMPYWIPPNRRQGVAVFDVSTPGNPTNLKSIEFDGYLVSSRRIGGKLHLVQQFMPVLPQLDYWYDGTPEDMENKISANKKAIDEMTLEQLIPHYQVVSSPDGAQQEGPAVSSDNFYCPVLEKGGGTITTIVTVDLDDATLPFESVGMVANAHIVYASTQALYIATHKYWFNAQTTEETLIYKFDLTGDVVQFAGGGAIPGWILNQFSLGEYQGVLRVATNVNHAGGWRSSSKNNIYCLQQEGKELKVTGKIEDLAPGEQIYAARFMGDRGYLVTFVKIDPLFTLDLSDPTAPKVAGILKVPGFSDYIHPYGDNYLITVGKDATAVEENNMAWFQGVQLSIFNVGDFANPALAHKLIVGDRGTNTEAAYNHKAFMFWAENELLALPVQLYEHASPPAEPWMPGTKTFQGLYVYRVSTANGFDFLGRISTEKEPENGYYYYHWTRGIFVDQKVFAVTEDAVRGAEIDRIEESVQTIDLPPSPAP